MMSLCRWEYHFHFLMTNLSPHRRALTIALGLLAAGALTATAAQTTYQAETAALVGATQESINTGFIGSGYVNSGMSGSTITFNNVTGGGGPTTLTIRYALGANNPRTGNLIVNGSAQGITFQPTGAWTAWSDLTLTINLGNNANNTLQFATTGSDLANIDQITVSDATPPPPPPPPPPPGTTQVPRWQPQDFVFTNNSAAPSNPFQVSFSADATGPGGVKLSLLGFYDGGANWKIRFSPTVEGNWTLTTHSNLSGLNQQQASLVCIHQNAGVHGPIKVDTQHRHHFVFEDGTHWLPMGYECDWLWALDQTSGSLNTVNPFLDKISASGFNFVLLNAYAYDTTWRNGRTGNDDFGPSALYAWEGSNANPDHTRFNLAYWRHYDQVIEALNSRGMIAHIYFKVYNKQVNWPAVGSAEDDQYYRWLVARYSAYPNVTWDVGKESQYEKSVASKINRMNFIRSNDPYHRLITIHDDRANYNNGTYNNLLDYRSAQEQANVRSIMQKNLAQNQWPVFNVEYGYEEGPNGPSDKTYSHAESAEEDAQRAWSLCMAGGYVAYYYTYTAWDVIRPTDTPPGYAYMKNLHSFFQNSSYWLLQPADNLVTAGGFCLADPGQEYLVFHPKATTFNLTIAGASRGLTAEWLQAFTGARRSAGTLNNGTVTLTPPADFGSGPVALHVTGR